MDFITKILDKILAKFIKVRDIPPQYLSGKGKTK
tara:strand:+ start:1157 stop:1258 length:102 start_codon:yes stop_codon:yes gene_type:complete